MTISGVIKETLCNLQTSYLCPHMQWRRLSLPLNFVHLVAYFRLQVYRVTRAVCLFRFGCASCLTSSLRSMQSSKRLWETWPRPFYVSKHSSSCSECYSFLRFWQRFTLHSFISPVSSLTDVDFVRTMWLFAVIIQRYGLTIISVVEVTLARNLYQIVWLMNADWADTKDRLFIQNVKDLQNNIWFCKMHVNLLECFGFQPVSHSQFI